MQGKESKNVCLRLLPTNYGGFSVPSSKPRTCSCCWLCPCTELCLGIELDDRGSMEKAFFPHPCVISQSPKGFIHSKASEYFLCVNPVLVHAIFPATWVIGTLGEPHWANSSPYTVRIVQGSNWDKDSTKVTAWAWTSWSELCKDMNYPSCSRWRQGSQYGTCLTHALCCRQTIPRKWWWGKGVSLLVHSWALQLCPAAPSSYRLQTCLLTGTDNYRDIACLLGKESYAMPIRD